MRRRKEPWWGARPAWEWPGLPWDLKVSDFADADAVLASGEPVGRILPAPSRMVPSLLYATEQPANAARVKALKAWEPRRVAGGFPVHPVLLAPDPTPTNGGRQPVAIIGATGYLGSMWSDSGSAARPAVDQAAERGLFYVIEAAIERLGREPYVRTVWPERRRA